MGAQPISRIRVAINNQLLQFRVLHLGLLQDGDVGVGVFPEGEEVIIGSLCLGGVALHGVGAPILNEVFAHHNPCKKKTLMDL